ncbi:MAG: toxin TcdB middle/N-terminal domain-containing protein, partial [Gammaproteobacteria bacterium]
MALDYTAGFKQQVDQRLSQVEVRAGGGTGSLVTRYDLVYVQAPDSNRSLLASVQRFGSNGASSLPPWEFDYQTSARSFGPLAQYQSSDNYGLRVGHTEGGFASSGSIDLNGDALPDYVHRDVSNYNYPASGAGTHWIRNLGLAVNDPTENPPTPGFLHKYQQWSASNFNLSESDGSWGTLYRQLIDLDGDRFPDALDAGNTGASTCAWTIKRGNGSAFAATAAAWQNAPAYTYQGVGYPSRCGLAYGSDSPFTNQRVVLIDLTGDGRPDRVLSMPNHAGSWQVAINYGWNATSGTGSFSNAKTWPEPSLKVVEKTNGSGSIDPLLFDVNGDGLPDHVWWSSQWNVAYNFGAGFEPAVAITGPVFGKLRNLALCSQCGFYADVLDINGDGLPDRLEMLSSPTRLEVWFGTGTGFKSSSIQWQPGGGWWNVGGSLVVWRPADWMTWGSAFDLRDLNGDGLLDRAPSVFHESFNGHTTFNAGPFPDLMSAASSPLGGVVQYEYGAAANQPNAAGTATANGNLPMPRWVVAKTTRSDGRVGTPQIVDTFLYRNGGYDRAEREFRGFGEVVQSALLTGGAVES